MRMDAELGADRRPLVADVVAAVARKRPSHASAHQLGPQLKAVRSAKGDRTTVAVRRLRFAGDGAPFTSPSMAAVAFSPAIQPSAQACFLSGASMPQIRIGGAV